MVELQSCAAGLLNASALCAIEEEVKGESMNVVIAEISAELQKEREKNAQLMERISLLEAQIQEKDKELYSLLTNHDGQGSCCTATERYIRKFKRQKTEASCDKLNDGNTTNGGTAENRRFEKCIQTKDGNLEERLVNWMSMDETPFLHFDYEIRDGGIMADSAESDESDDEDDDCCREDGSSINLKINESKSNGNEDSKSEGDYKEQAKIESITISEYRPQDILNPGNKRSSKVPFCPKEVKRMLVSEHLLLRNAQSHTIRKILVFASLGIRHGCEDMYELNFNHFHILRKGESYVSPKNPGEHLLYENPGVRKKVFYPNRQNPTLCPVQILEEEKAMRPSDPSCPSYLFLCIKYGGRTRNLPQNEYVRQRMGRNKLKSFGPIMCKMAMLVHVCSGSFFFKALGITLLFMAGFPDDMVQRETKYRNLDLLQKYYRTDKNAGKEELFLSHSTIPDFVTLGTELSTGNKTSAKSKAKKRSNSTNKPLNFPRSSVQQQSPPSNPIPPMQFGLMSYAPVVPSQMMNNSSPGTSYQNQIQNPYNLFPPQPPSTFMPMLYWPLPPSAFPPTPYPTTYGYRSLPSMGNYISIQPHPDNNRPSCSSFVPKIVEGNGKSNVLGDEGSDSDSTSSSNKAKEASGK